MLFIVANLYIDTGACTTIISATLSKLILDHQIPPLIAVAISNRPEYAYAGLLSIDGQCEISIT